jgi:hypothetical protein
MKKGKKNVQKFVFFNLRGSSISFSEQEKNEGEERKAYVVISPFSLTKEDDKK